MTNEEVLRAIADKKPLQRLIDDEWVDIDGINAIDYIRYNMVDGQDTYKFRITPEPKPDIVLHMAIEPFYATRKTLKTANVIETFDGETHELKSVAMIGKPCPVKMEALLRGFLDHSIGWDELRIKEVLNDVTR